MPTDTKAPLDMRECWKRERAAIAGPWAWVDSYTLADKNGVDVTASHATRVFMAHAREDLPAALTVIEQMVRAIERVAPPVPINQDEFGGCIWCDHPAVNPHYEGMDFGNPYIEDGDPKHHETDCPWLAARAALSLVTNWQEQSGERQS